MSDPLSDKEYARYLFALTLWDLGHVPPQHVNCCCSIPHPTSGKVELILQVSVEFYLDCVADGIDVGGLHVDGNLTPVPLQ